MRELVARLNRATARREDSEDGTREFREAEGARKRYRQILLDDQLFERFLEGDPTVDPERNGKSGSGNGSSRHGSSGRSASVNHPRSRAGRATSS
jgi:hypothetical protein